MNNFYITVSNGLLKDNHQERMGAAIWQYMWLLDKITKIDDDGFGWVLGGKPINLKDIAGKSKVTVSRNLTRLEKEGYITLLHTPYGIVIKVCKAKKRFNKNDKPVGEKRIINNDKPRTENDKPRFNNDKPNKIIQLDKTVDITTTEQSSEVVEVIDSFKKINPSYGKWYGNTTQRGAILRMLLVHGKDQIKKVVDILPKTNTMPYIPTITTPLQLEEKWAQLAAAMIKKKAELTTKGKGII